MDNLQLDLCYVDMVDPQYLFIYFLKHVNNMNHRLSNAFSAFAVLVKQDVLTHRNGEL